MSKAVSDIVIANSPTRVRGNGKPAVMVLFNYVMGWWIPEYVELRLVIDRLVEVEGKAKVEKALGITIKAKVKTKEQEKIMVKEGRYITVEEV